jgi:TolB-like protein/DNA-binding winged helix-turn-helix (wHTH) protein/Flp pilus assembly protein TadD
MSSNQRSNHLKHSQGAGMPGRISELYAFGEFRMDAPMRVLLKGEHPIALTAKAFEVLTLLIQHRGEVVSKDDLMQTVWPDSFVEESNLTQTVFMLRKALGETSTQRYILTVQGRGYRFAPEVKVVWRDGEGRVVTSPSIIQDPGRPQESTDPQVPASRIRRSAVLAFALLAILVIGVRLWLWPVLSGRTDASTPLHSIAVLPLDNLSGDSSQEYFVDGMTDELITDLAKVSALRVVSRTSVMRYKGSKKSLPEIAQELHVDGIVEGSVTRSGSRVRITAQLIRALSDQHIWAESYDRDLGDVLKLQNEVAQAITQQVRAQLTPQQQARLHAGGSVNPEAYDAYLRGQFFLLRDVGTAEGYFEEAIKKNPAFAPAYAGLAEAYLNRGSLRGLAPGSTYRLAEKAALKALQLDPSIGEAHTTLAVLKWRYDFDNSAAEREFTSALSLAPYYDCLHSYYASYLAFRGRRDEAMAEIARGRELSPSINFDTDEASADYLLGDYEKLVEASRRGVSLEPESWFNHYFLGVGYQGLGKRDQALPEFQAAAKLSNGDQDPTAAFAHAYAITGRKAEAQNILRELDEKSKTTYVSPYMIATIYAGLGDHDKAFKLLERAYQERSMDLVWNLKTDPRVNGLRSDPRFQILMRHVGLN